ncbi:MULTISPECIES: hypothetical protein [unclassified Streptomyces]|uniref:hypothetical protein n=1 Tax=unclassified Streptomyces TaxID=2593676 RepID=UPI002DD96567|nr:MULTISPECIES: hypothetical protein [unclassified Streptomyces]WSA95817.1 hypothetical protein OIE63_32860 [Streptomyces sp. NBC_01795]WSB80236.1 hypothetical protein OHB04_33975 [Streptomyces sp. NBC_01775]WSS11556.1 hypothetical protein OG533_06230 [Streptomyces sp. NBC_01186]WSS40271.1 hypothetical protein OG220_06380 [Streptomyces sp. NBC_01187]
MQKTEGTTHDRNDRRRGGRTVVVSGNVSHGRGRPDGPMGYGPRRSADENDPEPHIFRGED